MGRRDAPTTAGRPAARSDRRCRRRDRARRLRLAAIAATVLSLTSCYLLDPDLLAEGTDTVTIEVGETAQVALGEWSPGVGDDWGAVPVTDDSAGEHGAVDDGVVVADVVMNSEVFGVRERRDGPEAGGSFPYAVELTGVAPGTSTVRLVYCYRTAIAEDCDQGPRDIDPIEITVTVS
ncbi:hypothetical protein [Brachybacterium sp. AOP3-A1-3]|uniref:hypothetical protein n=1 Tax=Brachybacterium sp. AOP3-A1-3 TaxID=3457699 RepID=UPI0040344145